MFDRLFRAACAAAASDFAREAGERPMLRCNEAGIALIKSFEQCRLKAYDDGVGVQTIGWGHTHGVRKGDTCSQAEADEWFLEDLESFEDALRPLFDGYPTTSNQFSACVSLAYNIGAKAFAGSTVLKRHRLKNYVGAANAFLLWNRVNKKVWPGLTRRREAERLLYLA